MPDWQKVTEDFLIFKQAQGCADSTLNLYRWRLDNFFGVIGDGNLEKEAIAYFAGLQKQAPATYNIALRLLKCFFGWCKENNIVREIPVKQLKKRRDEPKIRNIPMDTIKKLLKLPDQKTFAGLRDYGLILFSLDTGARPGESLKLLPEHFNFRGQEATIPAEIAKSRYSRTVPFSKHSLSVLQRLSLVRPDDWGGDVPLLASSLGDYFSPAAWSRRMRAYSKQLDDDVTPYDLRHTFALEYLRNGGDVFSLQRIMGHADLDMTKRYVALAKMDIRQAHQQASPVNKLLKTKTRMGKL